MLHSVLKGLLSAVIVSFAFSGCIMLHQSSKYSFNDGTYKTSRFSKTEVYVLHVDEDTLAVFPVQEFKDSTAIITAKRTNYTSQQKKMKDNKVARTFYKPSLDLDVMTIPVKFRPAVRDIPGQLLSTVNGALFAGYRIDEYKLTYKRTPLNIYKQKIKHLGYSAGLYAGIGNTFVTNYVLTPQIANVEYEGVILMTGVAVSIAADKFTFGISYGVDHLMDRYRHDWVYQGKPTIGFTLGLNIN